jgi:hypothetical protein
MNKIFNRFLNKGYILLVFDTDKEVQNIFQLFNENEVKIMSFSRGDFLTSDKYIKIVFCNSKENTGKEIDLINQLFHSKCISKNTEIIHLEDIFNLKK